MTGEQKKTDADADADAAAIADAVAERWKKNGLVVEEQTVDDDLALAGGAKTQKKKTLTKKATR